MHAVGKEIIFFIAHDNTINNNTAEMSKKITQQPKNYANDL
jgi:hypothetical protein